MFAIVIVLLICSFVTLWIMMFVTESNDMSFKEYFTGKELSDDWRDRIYALEKRVKELENSVYIAGDK